MCLEHAVGCLLDSDYSFFYTRFNRTTPQFISCVGPIVKSSNSLLLVAAVETAPTSPSRPAPTRSQPAVETAPTSPSRPAPTHVRRFQPPDVVSCAFLDMGLCVGYNGGNEQRAVQAAGCSSNCTKHCCSSNCTNRAKPACAGLLRARCCSSNCTNLAKPACAGLLRARCCSSNCTNPAKPAFAGLPPARAGGVRHGRRDFSR
jgi:hypothetical protein